MTKRQRFAAWRRFLAPGRASNYEMKHLREEGHYRDTRWIYPWESLAEPFHPRTKAEWELYMKGDDDGQRTDV